MNCCLNLFTPDWFTQLYRAAKYYTVENGFKRVYYDFGDGREMAEDYHESQRQLVRRMWRTNGQNWELEIGHPDLVLVPASELYAAKQQQTGEPVSEPGTSYRLQHFEGYRPIVLPQTHHPVQKPRAKNIADLKSDLDAIQYVCTFKQQQTHTVTRINQARSLEWHISNVPFEAKYYFVEVVSEGYLGHFPEKRGCMMVVQKGGRFYHMLPPVPELERLGLEPLQEKVSWRCRNDTLIVLYLKPDELLDLEEAVWEIIIKRVPPRSDEDASNRCVLI